MFVYCLIHIYTFTGMNLWWMGSHHVSVWVSSALWTHVCVSHYSLIHSTCKHTYTKHDTEHTHTYTHAHACTHTHTNTNTHLYPHIFCQVLNNLNKHINNHNIIHTLACTFSQSIAHHTHAHPHTLALSFSLCLSLSHIHLADTRRLTSLIWWASD